MLLVGFLVLDDDVVAGDLDHLAGHRGEDHVAGVLGGADFDAGADQRGIGREQGTAWRCMFEPISARLASSCSRKGIRAVDTEMICLGDTSM